METNQEGIAQPNRDKLESQASRYGQGDKSHIRCERRGMISKAGEKPFSFASSVQVSGAI